jgi:hypothetical protein
MSQPASARPLHTRIHRSLQRYAVVSPLTLPADRARIAAELARRTSS